MNIRDQFDQSERRWYAVRCKYKCEKRLSEELKRNNIRSYVPLQKKVILRKTGRFISETPLIYSHIFCCINQSEYISVLTHPHVYQFVNFSGKIHQIPEREMKIMQWVVGEIDDVKVNEGGLKMGDKVVIINGELTGLKGVLIEKSNYNFKVVLESLGIGLQIHVDPKNLMKVGSTLLAV